ncbi:unnamed protein product [Menidia menidia]|uniref:tRNA (carboxymethyluridine(34)-5-O)-methyltransferase n=1 Tax=Menidia menidia TaxID=238744 RepID=A0A8S4BVE7_9TELE|nr:unnamed protein product [Menidia menidia]
MDPAEESNVNVLRKSKDEKKVFKKQLKASHTLLKHEGIRTATHPTKSLVVANGGLGNNVTREELSAALKEMGEVESLVMPPHKPYAFVTYRCENSARKAHTYLNGHKLHCGEQEVTFYLSYVESVNSKEETSIPLPEGLVLVQDYVSPQEEAQLLAAVQWSATNEDVTAQKALRHRRVKHYGFEFRYDNNNVDKDKPLPAGLPEECFTVLERCLQDGIPPHVDTHSAFEDTILSLSLGAQTVMEFRHPDGHVAPVLLPGRSLLVMKGESRYLWTHGITPRKFDLVPANEQHDAPHGTAEPGTPSSLTLSKRGTRTSFTFRKIRHAPCRCAFPSTCDSQGSSSPPSLPSCQADAARLEEEYVHRVYDAIASHFSRTRHTPWPQVCRFLSSLPPGSVLADVGCGNGKYLGVNPQLVAVGCDRSSALVQICAERGFHAFVSDALSVPLRTASCDACISIAVIHHFSTQARRLAAVRELVRLLKPGGQALIYVWAFEQEYNKQKSKYLKDQNKEHHKECSPTKDSPGRTQDLHGEPIDHTPHHLEDSCNITDNLHDVRQTPEAKLSVHTNRTAFNTQDLLVPWHLKGGKVQGERESARAFSSRPDPSPGFNSSTHSGSKLDTSNATHQKLSLKGETSQASGCTSTSDSESSSVPVFHRYYHVFQQGELEQLCGQVAGVQVKNSYHDQGNWCVVLMKE